MSIPKFVGTIVTKTKVWLDSTRHKLVHRKIVVAMVARCKIDLLKTQVGIITKDNPIWLNIRNKVVSVSLRGCGHRNEFWTACLTADSHDLEVWKRKEFC